MDYVNPLINDQFLLIVSSTHEKQKQQVHLKFNENIRGISWLASCEAIQTSWNITLFDSFWLASTRVLFHPLPWKYELAFCSVQSIQRHKHHSPRGCSRKWKKPNRHLSLLIFALCCRRILFPNSFHLGHTMSLVRRPSEEKNGRRLEENSANKRRYFHINTSFPNPLDHKIPVHRQIYWECTSKVWSNPCLIFPHTIRRRQSLHFLQMWLLSSLCFH